MNIQTELRDDHQARLTVEFDQETFEGYKRKAARKIASEAKIPGFRPGKAPYDVIRRMYGDGAIDQEAVELLIDALYPKIL
ncbi:MAG TPA: trigger factor family protein, partial [Anaerolineaceae bacterium]|nr:trigger factor family protein [Anaerolineaceae bacterium]